MRLKKRILFFAVLGLFLVGSDAFAAKKRPQEKLLLKGINHYEAGYLEDAMENFMEVLRIGGTDEEASLAKDYLHRITLKISGRPADALIPGLTPQSKGVRAPQATPSQAALPSSQPALKSQEPSFPGQPPGESAVAERAPAERALLPAVTPMPSQEKPKELPKEKPQEISITEEVLEEYYERRFRAGRLDIYEKLKANNALSLVLKGQDKIRALRLPYDVVFDAGSHFKPQAKDFLTLLTQAVYYHTEHLIRIHSGFTRGRSTLSDLQKATVLGGYLTNKGISQGRIEIELEGVAGRGFFGEDPNAPALSRLLENREGALVIIFEEFSEPFYRYYFLTKYLPKRVSSKEYPALSLGISQERLNARVGEGVVIELFANSNPTTIAQWSLKILTPEKRPVLDLSGKGAVLKSVYFEGKEGLTKDFNLLPSGKYRVEAEALNVAGARMTVARELDIVGLEPTKAEVRESLSAEEEKPKSEHKQVRGKIKRHKSSKKKVALALGAASSKASVNHIETQVEPAKASPAFLAGEILTYKIVFEPNETVVPSSQMATLEKLAKSAKLYPLQRFSIIGQASPEEKQANDLARQRVEEVVEALSAKYGVERSRLNLTWAVGEKDKREVEIFVEQ